MNTYQFAFKPGGSTHLHEGEGSLLSRALVFIKQLLCFWLHTLQHWFLSRTRPTKTSVLLGTVADLARGKSELVAENALLRHQLIILRRQIQRPMCTKRDRILLVLLARTGRDLEASALDRPAGDASTLAPSRISPLLEVQVKSQFCQT